MRSPRFSHSQDTLDTLILQLAAGKDSWARLSDAVSLIFEEASR